MPRTLTLVAPLLVLCAIAAPIAAQSGERATGFTAAERSALLAGELVRRDGSRLEGGRMLYGGASWQHIDRPLDDVWAIATDAAALTRLIPSLDSVRVIEEHDDARLLELHHSYGISEARYAVTMRFDHGAHVLRFSLDPSRPHDIRAGRGHLQLTRYHGGTIVEWSMLVDPGGGIVTDLVGPMLSEWLLQPPRCMRDELMGAPSC